MSNILLCAADKIVVKGVPEEIKLLPLGLVQSQKGDFKVDDESVTLIIKQFKEKRIDLVIDYEHQTLESVQAPAGGWIKDIYKGEDAIIAKVEWTPKAVEYLKNKEYRYLSPVVIVRKKDQKAMAIHSVALTNTPAIDGMFAIINSVSAEDKWKGESNMDLNKLAEALGLPETATEEEILKALAEATKALEQVKELAEKPEKEQKPEGEEKEEEETKAVANSTILSLLGLPKSAKTEDVAAMIMSLKVGDSKLETEFLALKRKLEERNADELVVAALKEGKITAAQKKWAKEYVLKDEKGFKNFMAAAPVVVPMGHVELNDAPQKEQMVDVRILKNCGISEEDYKVYGKKESNK